MIASAQSAPSLLGHSWRPLRREDAPALSQLEVDCAPIDGGTGIATIAVLRVKLEEAGDDLASDSLCAVDSTGKLAAAAWVTCDESLRHQIRFFLEGRVHPMYRGRGVGFFILQWMESRARKMLSELNEDRPGVLRIDFYDRGDDAVVLFEQHGFRFAFADDEMRRDLSLPLLAAPLPDGMALVTWSPQNAPLFFDVYQEAFRERPRFPHWSEEVWRHNFTGGAGFRPDLSLLLLKRAEAVGFAISHVETDAVAWIAQVGIRPAWRNRGLGGAVLCEVMSRFRAAGLRWAALEVNIDNDNARRLYQRLGFERLGRRSSYQKAVDS